MARELSSLDALVVGINITHYLKELEKSPEKCSYPAADFELLSKFIQKKLNFPSYVTPVLLGYSSGATLVYATLVQAPSNTFRGAISLGFCPDLLLTKPFCRGSGLEWKPGPKGNGYSFLPAITLEIPWIALQGTIDQVCDPAATESYVKQVKHGEIVLLPKVGHGFSVPRDWLPQFKQSFSSIVQRKDVNLQPPPVAELKDLPLVEIPASGTGKGIMAVEISGDGGWGITDRGIGNSLVGQGIPVVGLNSLQYFWTRRTPESSSKDLERIIRYYLATWKKDKVILIGYSQGADVLPFIISRLPEEIRSRVELVVLLGPDETVDFEFHLTDWLGDFSTKTSLQVLPEVKKLKGMKIICFYGKEEEETLCKSLDSKIAEVIPVEGGHRMRGRYEPVVESILKETK
jgi:type IV secretory pathway VirJ component